MDTDKIAAWLPFFVALIGAATGGVSLYLQSRRENASVAAQYEEMATRQAVQIAELRRELDKLQDSQHRAEAEIEMLRAGVGLLIAQLKANGIKPVWEPVGGPTLSGKSL